MKVHSWYFRKHQFKLGWYTKEKRKCHWFGKNKKTLFSLQLPFHTFNAREMLFLFLENRNIRNHVCLILWKWTVQSSAFQYYHLCSFRGRSLDFYFFFLVEITMCPSSRLSQIYQNLCSEQRGASWESSGLIPKEWKELLWFCEDNDSPLLKNCTVHLQFCRGFHTVVCLLLGLCWLLCMTV